MNLEILSIFDDMEALMYENLDLIEIACGYCLNLQQNEFLDEKVLTLLEIILKKQKQSIEVFEKQNDKLIHKYSGICDEMLE